MVDNSSSINANRASRYTLEQHLKSYEMQSQKYQHLWNSWGVEKKKYIQRLEGIVRTFDEYSLHDVNHSEKIIEHVERLLGVDRINLLSASDTWMLLQCAYTHDLGMISSEDERYKIFAQARHSASDARKLFGSEEFKPHIDELCDKFRNSLPAYPHSRADDLDRTALTFWSQFYDSSMEDERYIGHIFGDEFSLASFYFDRIIEIWFRAQHAERSQDEMMKYVYKTVEKDTIPANMRIAVADINYCHGGAWDRVESTLEPLQIGIDRDYIHPKFVAALLRMGDLLDLDSTRFNPYQLKNKSRISDENVSYMLTHIAVSEFLVEPKKISVTAHFRSDMVKEILLQYSSEATKKDTRDISKEKVQQFIARSAKIMRSWMEYIRINAQEFRHAWNDIAPENFPGCIAIPNKLRILIDEVELTEKDFDLRYEISPKRSAEIIEGSGLYDTPLVLLREVIQNAIDATKRQIYRDLRNMNLLELCKETDNDNDISLIKYIKKFGSEDGVFSKYVVQVAFSLKRDSEGVPFAFVICIDDTGIGITRNRLGKMKHIGAIADTEAKKEVDKTPEWLKPTGAFGIGMQSVFLAVDSFIMKSHPRELEDGKERQRRIVFNSTRLGGDITCYDKEIEPDDNEGYQWEDLDKSYPNGTRVEIEINLADSSLRRHRDFFDSVLFGEIGRDYFYNVPYLLSKSCAEYLKRIFVQEIVPIRIEFEKGLYYEGVHCYNSAYSLELPRICPNNWIGSSICVEQDSIYFWYNEKTKTQQIPSLQLLLSYSKTQKEADESPRLFYRGIRFYEKNRFGNSNPFLSRLFEVNGHGCDINIMSGFAGDILEINRDWIKSIHILTLWKQLSKAFQSFLDAILNNNEIDYMTIFSDYFRKLLILHSLITKNTVQIVEQRVSLSNIDCMRFNFSPDDDSGVDWEIYKTSCPLTELVSLDSESLWFTDSNEDEYERSEFLTLKSSKHYRNIFPQTNAVCNPVKLKLNLHYDRLIVFQIRELKDYCLVKLYQSSTSEHMLPKIDEYSYFLIVQSVIQYNVKRLQEGKIDDKYFPAFPSCDSSDLVNIVQHVGISSLPLGADQIEEDNFKQWIISPFPIGMLRRTDSGKHMFFWQDEIKIKELFDNATVDDAFCSAYKSIIRFICNSSNRSVQLVISEAEVKANLKRFAVFLHKLCSKFIV